MKTFFIYAQLVRLPNTFTAMADIVLGALASGWVMQRWFEFLHHTSIERVRTFLQEAGLGFLLPSTLFDLDRSGQSVLTIDELRAWGTFIGLLMASTLLYWSGMIWNDYFDLNQDRIERPGRPLASGRVSLQGALLLGFVCMLGGVLSAVGADFLQEPGRFRATPFALALVLMIFLYDGVFKKTWVGPISMGMCRSLNILLGLTVLGTWPPLWGMLLALVVGLYITGVTWFASTEAQLSRQTALLGAAIVMLASLILALTVPAVALETSTNNQPSLFFPYLLSLFGVYLGLAVLRAIKDPRPSRVQRAIKRAIFGLVILDALLASAFVGSAGLLLALLLIPGLVLGRWLYST